MTAPAAPTASRLVLAPRDQVDPDALSAAVLACPAVAGLTGGRLGGAATYLPGRRVEGVVIGDDAVILHVVMAREGTVRSLQQQVVSAARPLTAGLPVEIVVEDLAVDVPGEERVVTGGSPRAATRLPTPTGG